MEMLVQKYFRYFYIILIIGILLQMVNIVVTGITISIGYRMFITIALSVLNLILLMNDIKFSLKQQFTESKLLAKVLRFTILPLLIFQMWLCLLRGYNGIVLGDYLMSIAIIEVTLTFKIKCIKHLEEMANQFAKDNILDKKGE